MINKITLLGRLGKDVESKTVSNNFLAKTSIATDEKWYNEKKELQTKTTWHNLIVWGKQAEMFAKYLSKGSLVYIEGKQDNRMYEQDGVKKYTSEVIVTLFKILEKPKTSEESQPASNNAPSFNDSEEIPF